MEIGNDYFLVANDFPDYLEKIADVDKVHGDITITI